MPLIDQMDLAKAIYENRCFQKVFSKGFRQADFFYGLYADYVFLEHQLLLQ